MIIKLMNTYESMGNATLPTIKFYEGTITIFYG